MAQIVVVDGDEAFRAVYSEELRDDGHEVRTAATELEALRLLQRRVPDVVITEVRLPGLDAFDLMGRLIQSHREIVVVLNSGPAHNGNRVLGWVADASLSTSARTRQLRTRLREILDGARLARRIETVFE